MHGADYGRKAGRNSFGATRFFARFLCYNRGMIANISNMLKALNANVNPGEIAHAAACGFLLGLVPKDNLLWYLAFVFILFVRINKPTYLIMIVVGSAVATAGDPLFDSVGYAILTSQKMSGLFATLLEIPFVAFTKFNNTVVMGSLVAGLAAYVPVYALARLAVHLWRKYAVMALRNSRAIKIIGKIPVLSKVAKIIGERI